jgi:hypothetical protein
LFRWRQCNLLLIIGSIKLHIHKQWTLNGIRGSVLWLVPCSSVSVASSHSSYFLIRLNWKIPHHLPL